MLIALIGFRGSGKSTVGRLLADGLGYRFMDMDEEIEQREGRTVAEIFAADGEAAFRVLEQKLAAELAGADDMVIATGGGLVVNPAGVGGLLSKATVIYIDAPAAVLADRIAADNESGAERPPLTDADSAEEEVEALLEARQALYKAFSDATIHAGDRTPDEIMSEIMRFLDGDRH